MTYISPSTGREIKAVLFDTFGTVVDWRLGIARDVAAFAKRHRIDLDAAGFADAWQARSIGGPPPLWFAALRHLDHRPIATGAHPIETSISLPGFE
jgi:FMN phosphatase YigB (HAD superfamily)